MKIPGYTFVILLSLFLGQSQAEAAAFIKFDGVNGESKGKSSWTDIQSIVPNTIRPGKILIGITKQGKRVAVAQNGRYYTADGKMIIIVNGRVNRVIMQRKFTRPGEKVGINPQPEPPGKPAAPGAARGLNPQPEPPTANHRFVKPGELKGFNPQLEPPPAPQLNQAN